jgi:hypothetical protein
MVSQEQGIQEARAIQAKVRSELDAMSKEEMFDALLEYYDLSDSEKENLRQRVRKHWSEQNQ